MDTKFQDVTSDYTLIWDQRFVEPLIEHEPMDYTAPPPLTVEKVTQLELNEVSNNIPQMPEGAVATSSATSAVGRAICS